MKTQGKTKSKKVKRKSRSQAGKKVRPKLGIPTWLEKMLDNTTDETRVIAYVLIRIGPKNSKIWNEVIKWLEKKVEPFQQGDFDDRTVDEGVIKEWLAVYNVMGICGYE